MFFQCIINVVTQIDNGGTGGAAPANVKIANNFAGADLGAKINNADAACGENVGCEIQVYGGGTISTQVIIGSYHTLKLFEGMYYCSGIAGDGCILNNFRV